MGNCSTRGCGTQVESFLLVSAPRVVLKVPHSPGGGTGALSSPHTPQGRSPPWERLSCSCCNYTGLILASDCCRLRPPQSRDRGDAVGVQAAGSPFPFHFAHYADVFQHQVSIWDCWFARRSLQHLFQDCWEAVRNPDEGGLDGGPQSQPLTQESSVPAFSHSALFCVPRCCTGTSS